MKVRCQICDTQLEHLDEACPNCLPGRAERPPINQQLTDMTLRYLKMCTLNAGAGKVIKELESQLRAANARIAKLEEAAEFFEQYSHHEWKCFKYRHPNSDATCTCGYDSYKALLPDPDNEAPK